MDVQNAIAYPCGYPLRHLIGKDCHHIPSKMRASPKSADIPTHRDRQPVDDVHFEPCTDKWVEPILAPVDVDEIFNRNATVEIDKAPSSEEVDRQARQALSAQ